MWLVQCPECQNSWLETAHEVWNVVALTCPQCGSMLAVPSSDFSGDSNADQGGGVEGTV